MTIEMPREMPDSGKEEEQFNLDHYQSVYIPDWHVETSIDEYVFSKMVGGVPDFEKIVDADERLKELKGIDDEIKREQATELRKRELALEHLYPAVAGIRSIEESEIEDNLKETRLVLAAMFLATGSGYKEWEAHITMEDLLSKSGDEKVKIIKSFFQKSQDSALGKSGDFLSNLEEGKRMF